MSDTNSEEDYFAESDYYHTDEQLLNDLRDVYEKHGKVTIELYNDEDDVAASSVIIDRFGSWVEAKKKAGVGGDGRATNSRPRKYSTAELIEMIQKCDERYGNATQKNMDSDDDFCASGTVVKRFGSWSQAKKEAGVQ